MGQTALQVKHEPFEKMYKTTPELKKQLVIKAYNHWVNERKAKLNGNTKHTFRDVAWYIYCDIREDVKAGTNESRQRFDMTLEKADLQNKYLYSRVNIYRKFLNE